MSMEVLFSEAQIKRYFDALDMHDLNVKKTLSKIQTLHPELLKNLTYYLVEEIVSITDLFNMEINDHIISDFLTNIGNTQNTFLKHKKEYREMLLNKPEFKLYLARRKENSLNMMSRKLLNTNSDKYVTKYIIDEYGIKKNSFKSIVTPNNIYKSIVEKPQIQELIQDIRDIASEEEYAFGIIELADKLVTVISDNLFIINVELLAGRKELNSNTFISFILRREYLDVEYLNLDENLERILNEMASDYSNDATKTGHYTILRLLEDYDSTQLHNVFSSPNIIEIEVIKKYIWSVFLNYTLINNVYHGTVFDSDRILFLNTLHSLIIRIFEKAYEICMIIISEVKLAFPKIS